jgi:hypothetical protein
VSYISYHALRREIAIGEKDEDAPAVFSHKFTQQKCKPEKTCLHNVKDHKTQKANKSWAFIGLNSFLMLNYVFRGSNLNLTQI